jgi:uncharacterized protein YdeI (YjbR/CyaY-like superfamily)
MTPSKAARPIFFATPADFRAWLEAHHADAAEQWVGFHKRGSGKPSITWPESVDEALCFGWIDGLRKRIDDGAYMIRFTPRKRTSIWSNINVKRVGEMIRLKRMRPAGLKAFEARSRTGVYSFEQRNEAALDAAEEKRFRAEKKAWAYFQAQAPWYRRTAIFWATSAKRLETRARRLQILIDSSAAGRPVPPLTRYPKK